MGIPSAGGIDVTIGRGEFGRGFYSQTSSSNAQRKGFSGYGAQAATLRLEIDDPSYYSLNLLRLSLNQAQMLNAGLTVKTSKTYGTADDAIVGPLVNQHRIEQQKYQTPKAETLLNGLKTIRSII
jgi:hypothetical protein